MSLKVLLSVLTAITKIPGLLRWIGSLFEKTFEERYKEILEAEKELKTTNDPDKQDEALKTISSNLRSGDR